MKLITIFLSSKNNPYNFKNNLKTINTKNVKTVKEFAHVFYFFSENSILLKINGIGTGEK